MAAAVVGTGRGGSAVGGFGSERAWPLVMPVDGNARVWHRSWGLYRGQVRQGTGFVVGDGRGQGRPWAASAVGLLPWAGSVTVGIGGMAAAAGGRWWPWTGEDGRGQEHSWVNMTAAAVDSDVRKDGHGCERPWAWPLVGRDGRDSGRAKMAMRWAVGEDGRGRGRSWAGIAATASER